MKFINATEQNFLQAERQVAVLARTRGLGQTCLCWLHTSTILLWSFSTNFSFLHGNFINCEYCFYKAYVTLSETHLKGHKSCTSADHYIELFVKERLFSESLSRKGESINQLEGRTVISMKRGDHSEERLNWALGSLLIYQK